MHRAGHPPQEIAPYSANEQVNPSVCEPVCRVSDEGEHGR